MVRYGAVLIGLVLAPAIATAEDPAALRSEGEVLARVGRFSEAIDKFKAADRIKPAAANACLIALAYTRRELWPQAEIWLTTCRDRATPGEPAPDWAPAAAQQIHDRLAAANVAPVEIVVTPRQAEITVSSFALDEKFSARTIHLPMGRHAFIASAPGYEDGHAQLVVDDKTPKRVEIALQRRGVPTHGPRAFRVAGIVAGGAAVVAAGAGIWFGVQARSDADHISSHTMDMWTPDDERTFEHGQTANSRMIGAYIASGALLVTGGVLYYLGARTHLEPVVTPGSAGLAIEGRF
jgi:hypothetical protein